ncbi:ATP-dependent helicase [Gemmatimonas sp.]|uniref:ATP-dependent helicase n=1 Tax=Gemmatimonas sp. TaxID=1962908 RepID=UPI0022C58D81|nr:ATP-dependent helicase [Gemmatimonas sp.]MCZ8205860.1 ATP-dependent helicase [Gemmatimonas sp.]
MADDLPRVHTPLPARRVVAPPPAPEGPALNAAQADAASHGDTPLLIVAGAGSGKTRTLIHRVAALIHRGVPAHRILLLTFTRRAAQEMVSRCERLVGSDSRQVQGGTFHGTAHRLLRRFGPAAGLPADFTILDQGDAGDLMGLSRSALGYGDLKNAPRGAPRFPRAETLLAIYSRHVNTGQEVADILGEQWPHFLSWTGDIERCFTDYVRRKTDRNLLDYDDLLLSWALLLEQAPPIAQQLRALYDHVLVDEYQDTNPLQSRILRGLCTNGRLTVVGDDAQSIYAFRGATIRNILDFPGQFPGTRIITLEQNYRSTAPILESTNVLISRSTERYSKRLFTERDGGEAPWLVTVRDEAAQTAFVVDRLLELHEQGTPLREMAVLFRAGYLSADLEIELANRRIPYEKWGGLKFLEAAHVKDLLAFLRLLENPRDEVSWYRLLRLLPGVGDATARAAIELLAQHQWEPMALGAVRAAARSRPGLLAIAALFDGMRRVERQDQPHSPAESIRLVRQLYDPLLQATYDDAPPRMADLDQLETIAAGYPDRTTFLATLALEPPAATQDLAVGSTDEDDALILSTVHSAKGKEWDAVFVIHASDGVFPMARLANDEAQIEEERRLLYVAMTRARHELYVTYPLHSYATRMGADFAYSQLSRFLDPGVRQTMQRVTIGEPEPPLHPLPGPREGAVLEPIVDLRALLRGRFGG